MKSSTPIFRKPPPLQACLAIWMQLWLFAGCANWNPEEATHRQFRFPEIRLSKDAVALEIGVAQLDEEQIADLEAFWSTLDQQTLSLSRRRQLDRNGLRVAIMSTRAPAAFNELMSPVLPDPQSLGPLGKHLASEKKLQPVSRLLVHQRISNRAGESHAVATSDAQQSLACTLRDHEGSRVITATNATGIFEVTTFPNPDGSVRLSIAPKLRQGDFRRRFSVAEGSFILDQGQATTELQPLNFDLELGVGETMLVAATWPSHFGAEEDAEGDLPGDVLFHVHQVQSDSNDIAETNDNGTQNPTGPQRVLLVRLVQTQMDDLFERSAATEQLTTTPDW